MRTLAKRHRNIIAVLASKDLAILSGCAGAAEPSIPALPKKKRQCKQIRFQIVTDQYTLPTAPDRILLQ
jgi:hypothetical protein